LPLSDSALVALSTAIASSGSGGGEANPLALKSVLNAFQEDPPLLLFALLRWPGDDFVAASELAAWLIGVAADEFSGGDWILSAPVITNQHQYRWSRLMAESRSVLPTEWVGRAAEWLRVLGPEVDPQWIAAQPRLIWDLESGETRKLQGSLLLQQLAAMRQRALLTEQNLSGLADQRKNAAAKQLAYGLSHEINNPLANISARAQQLARDESDPKREQSLRQIVSQVYRAHEMIAGLMFFANPPEPDPEPVDLNTLLGQAAEEFQPSAARVGIRLLTETLDSPAFAEVDRKMILEAVRILLRNSIEAIGSGGTVVLSIQRVAESDEPSRWQIHVADSGPGLSAEASEHAFDPFYSGREAGRGLGLGLCRAYRIVELHQATIRLSGGLAGCVATIGIPCAAPRR
jgi:signal transduction histidine kinase